MDRFVNFFMFATGEALPDSLILSLEELNMLGAENIGAEEMS